MVRCWVGCAALILAATSMGRVSAAPRFTCYTVQRGDTAARLALRLTKDARNRDAPWFQIFDPGASAFVPKNRYEHIQPGWRVCIAEKIPAVAAHVQPVQFRHRWWWWAPVLLFATVLGWVAAQNSLEKRQATSRVLERFGTSFVREFERPLLQLPCLESPLRSRLRIVPQRNWMEVLLAPNAGWHYPNLSDHRKNVEYDVERIVALLGERRFVCGQLGTRGPWVVIPFRLEGGLKKEERA